MHLGPWRFSASRHYAKGIKKREKIEFFNHAADFVCVCAVHFPCCYRIVMSTWSWFAGALNYYHGKIAQENTQKTPHRIAVEGSNYTHSSLQKFPCSKSESRLFVCISSHSGNNSAPFSLYFFITCSPEWGVCLIGFLHFPCGSIRASMNNSLFRWNSKNHLQCTILCRIVKFVLRTYLAREGATFICGKVAIEGAIGPSRIFLPMSTNDSMQWISSLAHSKYFYIGRYFFMRLKQSYSVFFM